MLCEDLDVDALRQRIMAEVRTRGGTNLECGMLSAKAILDAAAQDKSDDIVRSNRIIYLTDMNPNSGTKNKHGLLGLTRTYASQRVFSTFIGVGIDFNTDLVSFISDTSGCNYYAVKSEEDFKKRMDTEFELMVTPLVFDLKLRLKSEGDSCTIGNIFGSGKSDEVKNQDGGDGETMDYEVMHVKTLFPSKTEGGRTKGGIIVIQLRTKGDAERLNFEIECTFKDKFNTAHRNEQVVTFESDGGQAQFDTLGIRKGILLSQYVSLIKKWLVDDECADNKKITVSEGYNMKFKRFLAHFEREMEALDDDSLNQDLDILKILAESDEPLSNIKPAEPFKYNTNSGAGYYYSSKSGILSMKYPVEHGLITNYDDSEKIWHHTFYNELRIAPEEHGIIVTEPPQCPKATREKITQIMFETFCVNKFFLAKAMVLGVYAQGRTTALVVDFGFQCTRVGAVVEGYLVPGSVTETRIGGGDVTDSLQKALLKRGYSLTTGMEREIVRDIKEQTAFVALDYAAEMKKDASESAVTYQMPSDALMQFDRERFECCECLFEGGGDEALGVHSLVVETLNKCDESVRQSLVDNVVLMGGTARLTGLDARLVKEVKKEMGVELKIVQNVGSRQYAAFEGGSILASLKTFDEMWITMDEYDEIGPSIVHKKCD